MDMMLQPLQWQARYWQMTGVLWQKQIEVASVMLEAGVRAHLAFSGMSPVTGKPVTGPAKRTKAAVRRAPRKSSQKPVPKAGNVVEMSSRQAATKTKRRRSPSKPPAMPGPSSDGVKEG